MIMGMATGIIESNVGKLSDEVLAATLDYIIAEITYWRYGNVSTEEDTRSTTPEVTTDFGKIHDLQEDYTEEEYSSREGTESELIETQIP